MSPESAPVKGFASVIYLPLQHRLKVRFEAVPKRFSNRIVQTKSFLMLAPNLTGVAPSEPRSELSESPPSSTTTSSSSPPPFPLTGVEKIFFAIPAISGSPAPPLAAFVADAADVADGATACLGVLEGVLGLWRGLDANDFAAEGLLKT